MTLNKPIKEEEVPADSPQQSYKYTEEEIKVVSSIHELFDKAREDRNKRINYFDRRTLIEYIEDSTERFFTNLNEREDIEDWQARVHDPFTRNKVLAILGKVVNALPVASFFHRGDEDILKVEILNTLFEYSEDKDDSEEFFIYFIEEAIVKGTAVGYEGITTKDKKVRTISKYKNEADFSVKQETYSIRKLNSQIVPLEEFYPSSIGIRKIEDMPYCFWRKVIPYRKFLQDYSNHKKAEFVSPYDSNVSGGKEDEPFYKDYITDNVGDGNVEVIKYYNQDTDEYVIIANGLWLNPIEYNGEKEAVSPLPFNHKQLPFFSIKYDILGSDIFYGKSLPDRISVLQDVLDVLHNMLLDQSFLTIFPPILTGGVDTIEDDFLRPGRRIEVDTGGLPISEAYKTLDMQTPSGWHQYILEYTKSVLEESSMDSIQQGVAGVGGRTTATEIRSAAAGVITLLGLFAKFVKFGAKRRAKLRAGNILQFYTDPTKPIIDKILGPGGNKKMNKAFNSFKVDSEPTTPGKRGTKIIELFQKEEDLPTAREQKSRVNIESRTSKKKVNIVSTTADYIRNIDFDIVMVANPESPQSKDLEKALEIQFQQTFLGLYGDLANRKEMAAELAVKFDRDPSKVIKEEIMNPQSQGENTEQGLVPQGGSNTESTVKGATGVGQEGTALRDIMQSMQG